MSVYLARLARYSFLHRRLVVGLWLAVVIAVIAIAQLSGGKTVDDFTVSGTQSAKSVELLKERLPAVSGGSSQVVLLAPAGQKVTDSAEQAAIAQASKTLAVTPQVSQAADPITAHSVSADGRAALMQIQYSTDQSGVKDSTLTSVNAAFAPVRAAGVEVEYGGVIYPGSRVTPSNLPDLIGIGVGLIILFFTFGALLVAFLPIITAISGVIISLMSITILASLTNVASVSTALASMLGLSCGIDYALFIVSRYRNNVVAGDRLEDAIALAAGTAGSSVVFAALTVVVALCGLSVVGIQFLTIMGLAAAFTVLLSMVIALTLLPALLGFAGQKVVKFARGPRSHRGRPEAAARIAANEPHRTRGAGWIRLVTRHRVLTSALAIGVLLTIAIPVLDLNLGLPGGENKPTSSTAHKSYDLTTQYFGVGANGPLIVAVDLTNQKSTSASTQILTALQKEPDVASAIIATTANKTTLIRVTPTSGPNADQTTALVKRIRTDATTLQTQTGTQILVGGTTASNIDTSKKLSNALPTFLLVIIGLAFVLLTLAFRTILVPIKSVIGFLLSVAAAFGAEVAVFQWGWLKNLLGINPGQTLSFLPIICIAIVFGLSSDYEVFVVSRIKEDYTRTHDGLGSIQRGAGKSARVVTAAALIMFAVFCAFILNSDSTVKAIGLTLATAVFLDAFLVRLTLVPAIMALIQGRFWYHPRWFAKYIPNFDIEGEKIEHLTHQQHTPQPEPATLTTP